MEKSSIGCLRPVLLFFGKMGILFFAQNRRERFVQKYNILQIQYCCVGKESELNRDTVIIKGLNSKNA